MVNEVIYIYLYFTPTLDILCSALSLAPRQRLRVVTSEITGLSDN